MAGLGLVPAIRALLVDDEPWARRRLTQLLAEAPDFTISGECRNGTEALAALRQGSAVDVVFLDVQMPDMSGVQVLQQLGDHPLPLVVFVTAYDDYAVQAFERHAVDYLLKPLDPDRFASCLAHVRRLVAQRHHSRPLEAPRSAPAPPPLTQLLIKQPGRYYFVAAEQIQYLEARGNYVLLYVDGQPHPMRTTLRELEGQLDPQVFLRVHRSFIVNVNFVQELHPWTHGEYVLTLPDGTHLTSSRSYVANLQRLLRRGRP
jgi:two-component system LytT family response regulator